MDKWRNTLNLPKRKKRSLNLEKDLLLTREDLIAIRDMKLHPSNDLSGYLDFLDELWGSERKAEVHKRFYSESFCLK